MESYDWHSSVHGHWMLVRLLRLFPDLPEAAEVRSMMGAHLTAENLKVEADYFARKESKSFERHIRMGMAPQAGRGAQRLAMPRTRRCGQRTSGRSRTWSSSRYLDFLPQADIPDPNRRAPEYGVRAVVRA